MRSEALASDEHDPARRRVVRTKTELLVDKTGVGRGVTDILKERSLGFTGIVIHGGETTHETDGAYHVPKKDLVAALEVPFDKGTLKIAEGLELWPALREELQSFRRKQNPKTAHVSFEHWRDSDHDDLVLAVAMACWGATSPGRNRSSGYAAFSRNPRSGSLGSPIIFRSRTLVIHRTNALSSASR